MTSAAVRIAMPSREKIPDRHRGSAGRIQSAMAVFGFQTCSSTKHRAHSTIHVRSRTDSGTRRSLDVAASHTEHRNTARRWLCGSENSGPSATGIAAESAAATEAAAAAAPVCRGREGMGGAAAARVATVDIQEAACV